jgi:hypothetical protein
MRFDKVETATVCIFTIEYAGFWEQTAVRGFLPGVVNDKTGRQVLRFSTRGGTCLSRIRWMVSVSSNPQMPRTVAGASAN